MRAWMWQHSEDGIYKEGAFLGRPFQQRCWGRSRSPMSDSILQLIQDSAVQSINIRQLSENLSKPVVVQHRFPLVPDCCPHRCSKVLQHEHARRVQTLSCSAVVGVSR